MLLYDALVEHGIRHAGKTSYICSDHVISAMPIRLCCIQAVLVDILHDLFKTLVQFVSRPGQPHTVLGHLKACCGRSAGTGRLCRSIEDIFARLKHLDGLCCAWHIGTFADHFDVLVNQVVCIRLIDFIFHCSRESAVRPVVPQRIGRFICIVFSVC